MVQELKDFVMRGNLLELAVAFIMGAAFATLTASLVSDVVMPIIAIPLGEPSFNGLVLTINDSQILYGVFLTALVTFVATALAVFFFIVKPWNAVQARRRTEEPAAAGPTEIDLLTEIRDSLRGRTI
ncbi:MAG: large conductance mechanosensitive channel protein MscL [Actinobacteria bacterium]|nr:MAG: large conductance mechanosensitive channel protein MscL [Actinomycetota bacterium]